MLLLVELFAHGGGIEEASAVERARVACRRGRGVELVQALALPGQETLLLVFDGPSPAAIRTVIAASGLPVQADPEPVIVVRDLATPQPDVFPDEAEASTSDHLTPYPMSAALSGRSDLLGGGTQ